MCVCVPCFPEQDAVENIVPGSSTGASAATAAAAAPAPAPANTATWGAKHPASVAGLSSPSTSALPPPPSPFSMAAAAAAAQRFLPPPPPPPPQLEPTDKGSGGGKRAGTRGFSGGGKAGAASGAGGAVAGTRAKAKPKGKGAVGGQRPAVQAPVSKPQGTKGGGPGSFCSKVRLTGCLFRDALVFV